MKRKKRRETNWRKEKKVLTKDVMKNLSALIYCRDLDTTTLRDLIDSDGKLIPEDPQPGDAIERMEYRQSYHWDRYHGVFEHMDRVYSVPLQGAYNPLGYAQPQYDQCYQQYQPQQQHDDDEYFLELRSEQLQISHPSLRAKKESSDEECLTFGCEDEEYAMAVRDFKKFFRRRGNVRLLEVKTKSTTTE
ncbi:hypothetical protein Tco_0488712 [Tanacetum coccineum]